MKKFLLFIILLSSIFYFNICAQECATSANSFNFPCTNNFLDYLKAPSSISTAPLLTVRVNIHIVQDANGGGNFPNNQTAIDFVSGLFASDANICANTLNFTPYGHVEGPTWVINLPNNDPVPVLSETRIRFRLTGVYFHQDQTAWDNNNGDRCGSYCYNNLGINKGEDINIFFYNYTASSMYGCGLQNFVNFGADWANVDYTSCNTAYIIKGLLAHEIGHTLGLNHVNEWSGVSSPFFRPFKNGVSKLINLFVRILKY